MEFVTNTIQMNVTTPSVFQEEKQYVVTCLFMFAEMKKFWSETFK